jgi:hypothetical protein
MINRSTVEKEVKRDTLDDDDVRIIIQKVENGGSKVEEEEVIEHNESGKNEDFFART